MSRLLILEIIAGTVTNSLDIYVGTQTTAMIVTVNGVGVKRPMQNPWTISDTTTTSPQPPPSVQSSLRPSSPMVTLKPRVRTILRGNSNNTAVGNGTALASTAVVDGSTFTSPSIYVAFYSLSATDSCGARGIPEIDKTTIAFDPSELSTLQGHDWIGYFSQKPFTTKPLDTKDFPCPPRSIMEDDWYKPSPGEPYRPLLALPDKVRSIDPLWVDCTDAEFFTGLDPPRSLVRVSGMTPTTAPAAKASVTNDPAIPGQSAPAIASPTKPNPNPAKATSAADPKPEDPNTGDPKSVDPANTNPDPTKPKVSDPNAADPKSADPKSGNSVDSNEDPGKGAPSAVSPDQPSKGSIPIGGAGRLTMAAAPWNPQPAKPEPTKGSEGQGQGQQGPDQSQSGGSQSGQSGQSQSGGQSQAGGLSQSGGQSESSGQSQPGQSQSGGLSQGGQPQGGQSQSGESGQSQSGGESHSGGQSQGGQSQSGSQSGQSSQSSSGSSGTKGPSDTSDDSNLQPPLNPPNLIIGSSTFKLPQTTAHPAPVIADQTVSANPTGSGYQVGGQNIAPGGAPITVSGTPVHINPAGSLVAGSSTYVLPATAPSTIATVAGHIVAAAPSGGYEVGGSKVIPGASAITISGTPVHIENPTPPPFILPAQQPSPVTTVAGNTILANPSGYQVGSTPLTPGGAPVVVDGTSISLNPSNNIVINSQTYTLPTFTPKPATTIANHPIAILPSGISIDGTTLTPNAPAITISNTPISLGPSALVIGTSTVPLGGAEVDLHPTMTVGGQVFTAGPLTFAIGSTTLSAGGAGVTISGTLISLNPTGGLVVGTSTIALESAGSESEVDLHPTLTVGGQVFTAGPSAFAIGSTTLTAGGAGVTISGTPVSLNPTGGLVVGTSTIPLESTSTGLGGLIIGGFGSPTSTGGNGSTVEPFEGAASATEIGWAALAIVLGAVVCWTML